MQVVEGCCGSRMKPPGRDDGGVNGFPVEVIYHQTNVQRRAISNTDRNRLKHITETIIRGNYDCVAVFIDDSGSMKEADVRNLLNEWYWNISTSEASHATYVRYIVDSAGNPNPLSSCDSGGGNQANGCIYETKSPDERWLRHAANGAQRIYDDPDSCAGGNGNVPGCDCTKKTGWPEICAVFMDKSRVGASVNFKISWIKAGTLSDGVTPFVELKDTYGNVSNSDFKADIIEAFAVWKAALESACSWLTVNFIDMGDETITTLPSSATAGTYKFSDYPGANIRDIRIGMHEFDTKSEIAHAYSPGAVLGITGNQGGDTHFDAADRWRRDGQVVAGGFSIKMVTVHEIGHALGLPHLADINSIMYAQAKSNLTDYDTYWSGGVIADTTTYNALKELYCGV